ncbi:pyruvate, phosphate dikinase, chloroplastic-like [Arachis hypogaea]|uniref:Pyruvate, phosphate dikinase n=1 Tax=Arachis hypogaea TaxID=3818 RepID=A0A6B9VDS6_ARAHY|nr:Pyruvate, phosphate dikinase [Arachis hypogaea]
MMQVVVVGYKVLRKGEWISLNGSTGEVILGQQLLSLLTLCDDLATFMSWADEIRHLKTMANVDTLADALTARQNGAHGIGPCRTKHMISDFEGIFRAMDGLLVTIRLLDPPLYELILEGELHHIVRELTSETGINEEEIFSRIEKLSEVNPMLGYRGCRLGISSYLELTEMQVRAIFEAVISMSNHDIKGLPEIMVPLVGTPQELKHQVSLIRNVAVKVFSETGSSLSYKVGTMIEVPRATLIANELAVTWPACHRRVQISFSVVTDGRNVPEGRI